jgi:hypothetical protein
MAYIFIAGALPMLLCQFVSCHCGLQQLCCCTIGYGHTGLQLPCSRAQI